KWKDGVSTYLALTFGTLLSSQGTDASFGFPSGLPPGASLRCFRLYQTLFRSVSGPDSKSDSPVGGAAFRRDHYFRGFPARLKIEPLKANSGTPNKPPRREDRTE
ncbi:hypothetical protein FNX44_023095, partial [Streptomyces sp. OF1]|nr:hypothetical protein [Streptomyces alkaliterrae]